MKKTIIWGASGHAKVLLPILRKDGYEPVAFIDMRSPEPPIPGLPVFKQFEAVTGIEAEFFAVAIGGAFGADRSQIHDKLARNGLKPIPRLVHPAAYVEPSAQLADGVQVLCMAAVCVEVKIDRQTIINTGAKVDHECVIGQGVHIMPGATLAGCVEVGDYATIGSGATILPRIKIGAGAIVGAGSVVTKNVSAGSTVLGVPAVERQDKL